MRCFEDVKEGDAIPAVVVERLSRTDLVKYAGASGDFNPIHHDEEFARSAGNPTVFGHGMLTAGFVGRCITDFVGADNLRRYKVRFATRVWPGDTLSFRSRTKDVFEKDGKRGGKMLFVIGETEFTNQHGEVVAYMRNTAIETSGAVAG